MIGTLFSLIVAGLIFFYPLPEIEGGNAGFLALTLFVISALFILIQTAVTVFSWTPLQKTEQNLTPHLIGTFSKDRNLRLTNFVLLFFLFFTYLVVIDIVLLNQFDRQTLFVIWTISLGIAVDFLHHHLKRVMEFLDPFHVVEIFANSAHGCIRGAQEAELCDWIDALSETTVKAVKRQSSSLSLQAVDKLRSIARNYLEAAKRITYHADEERGKFGGADHVSYTLFFLFQRMELIFEKALQEGLEPVCSKIVTSLGKICIYGAKYDITLASYPVYYLGKLTNRAQQEGMQEVGNRATMTLLEISKVIIKDVDLQYVEIKEVFLSIVDNMHEIAKDTFKNDKSMNIAILTQPFQDLRELFQSPKLAEHQDASTILSNIDAVLNEFASLEEVMMTMPPVAQFMKESGEESEKEAAEEEPPEEPPEEPSQ